MAEALRSRYVQRLLSAAGPSASQEETQKSITQEIAVSVWDMILKVSG